MARECRAITAQKDYSHLYQENIALETCAFQLNEASVPGVVRRLPEPGPQSLNDGFKLGRSGEVVSLEASSRTTLTQFYSMAQEVRRGPFVNATCGNR
jgi:hypothetical protein